MYHYDAFISYNHNERDIKITRNLQHRLESYKLPKGTETSTGKEKIERVFLDTGELEVAGDLSRILQDALDNADNLIVICSPESKASIWVQREIEYFLQSHPIDRVHTVVTEGEPIDVLPDILLREEYTDEDGNVVTKAREPLSCDYRLPLKTANKQELPRLVAAIVGCRYDDLVQRQRQYRMRRQIALLASAAVMLTSATGYLVWSNNKIKENLNNTLREESLNLSIQSEQSLSRGDRIGAIHSALDALPSEENDRPVVPRAVRALSKAIDLYQTPQAEDWSAVRQYEAKGEEHLKVCAAEAGDRLFMAELFTNGVVSLWDAQSGSELMADYTGELDRIYNIGFTGDGKFVLVSKTDIYVADPAKEKELVKIPAGDELEFSSNYRTIGSTCDDLAFTEDSLWICVDHFDEELDEVVYDLVRADLDKGEIAEKHRINTRANFLTLSADGRYLSFVEPGGELDEDFEYHEGPDRLYLVDTKDKDGFENAAVTEKPVITCTGFYGNDRLIACGLDVRPDEFNYSQYLSIDYLGSGYRRLFSVSEHRNAELFAEDVSTGEQLWANEYEYFGSGVPFFQLRREGETGWDIAFVLWNSLVVTDKAGTELTRYNVSDVVGAFFNRDDLIRTILFNGELSMYDIGDKEMNTVYSALNGPIRDAISCKEDIFVTTSDSSGHSFSETVTQYEVIGADPSWEAYEYSDEYAEDRTADYHVASEPVSDGRIAEIRYDNNRNGESNKTHVLVRDSSDGKVLLDKAYVTYSLGDDGYYDISNLKYTGINPAADKVYFTDDVYSGIKLLSVDLQDGTDELKDIVLEEEGEDGFYMAAKSPYTPTFNFGEYSMTYDHIYYVFIRDIFLFNQETGESDDNYTLVAVKVDPVTGEVEKHDIRALDESEKSGFPCKINGTCERLLALEANTGEGSEEGGSSRKMVCYDLEGNIIWENPELPEYIAGFMIADDGSAVVLESKQNMAVAHFYSEKDGSETASSELEGVNNLDQEELSLSRISDDEYLLTAGNDAYLLDSATMEPRTLIYDSFIAYEPDNKQFVLGDADNMKTGHVPYRTLQEMIGEAQALVE